MKKFLQIDVMTALDVLDTLLAQYSESSQEYQAIEAGRFALLLGGKDLFKNFVARGPESYRSYKDHLETLDRPPTENELRVLKELSRFVNENGFD